MSRNSRYFCVAIALLLSATLTLSVYAKKGGNGNGNGGGDPPPPTLPDDLDVRYRVQYIPLPAGFTGNVNDVNDAYQVVGYYDFGDIRTGFYYDALTGAVLTASDMVDLPPEWVSTNFIGINNHGAIVGHVRDIDGKRNGLLIYPDADGYAFELTSLEGTDLPGTDDWYFRKINDWGDIVGVFWDAGNATDAFVYNPDLYDTENYLEPTKFGLPNAGYFSVQVSNARLATAYASGAGWFWFDVVDLQWSPITSLPLDHSVSSGLSNDGQLAVFDLVAVKKGPNKLQDRPGVILGDEYIWQGEVNEGRAKLVNSISGGNFVGDVVGHNDDYIAWFRYADRADWGSIDLLSMLLITPADQLLVDNGIYISDMSDRDSLTETGFPIMVGSSLGVAFVLIPVIP